MHPQHPGYGPQQQHPQPYGAAPYGAPPAAAEAERVTAVDIIVPLILSLFCGIGGFAWGLIRLAQGHKKPGVTALLVNLGVWTAFIALWLAGTVIMAAAGASVKPAP
jgi:hypothetical protein